MIELKMVQAKQLEVLHQEHQQDIQMLKHEFMDSFAKAEKVYSATKDVAEKSQKIYDEKVAQVEEEHELEIK